MIVENQSIDNDFEVYNRCIKLKFDLLNSGGNTRASRIITEINFLLKS